MTRLIRGALTAAVLLVLTALVGVTPANAAPTDRSSAPLSTYVRLCEQFGGFSGSSAGEASCILVPESRTHVLENVCRAAGGTQVPGQEPYSLTCILG